MTKHMNRRIFLRGVGGAVVAAPFLSSLGERGVKAQAAATPKRMIMMFTHYGCITTKFFPTKSHGALTAADLSPTLQPLAPYINKLLIPRGIRSMNEWTQNMKRGQGNDPHTQVVGSYFTCQPVTPNSDDPFSFSSDTKFQAKPKGPSLDHVITQALSSDGKGTPFLLRVGGQNDSPQSAISYSAATTAFPGYANASQAFSGLTGLFKTGTGGTTTPTPADYAAVRGKSVTDLVKDDLNTLERAPMSQADKMKLEAWKALLNDMGTVMASAQCSQDIADQLGATQANVTAAGKGGLGSDLLTTKISGDLDGADISSSVAALAAICNANPVIVLKYPGSYVFKGLNITTESHSLSHRLDNAGMSGTCLPNAVADLLKVDGFYTAKFANLLKMLDSVSEGDGTVLDNMAAIWFSEMSDGNAHNLNNAPIIQAGSMGGYFKQGWTVNVEDGSPTLSVGQSESQCTGSSTTSNGLNQGTGTDPKYANAPINKYFCNLMNSLGVRAGADGFPAKGGTGEVTHYGYSDKTEDFIHGGTNPATIHSPGEFTDLKASA